ncbi:MAG: hypothetical protein PHR67_07710 [Candidatus Cloacimonetes bacterium]|jgi:hypothetical protein|nr:hypothetical protein [Candidatus Cloacimonadota bacterium]
MVDWGLNVIINRDTAQDALILITAYYAIQTRKQVKIMENQESDRKRKESKAYLVAHAKNLSTTYVIEIHNQGSSPAKDVVTLIDDKPISENPQLIDGQSNISNIASKDWITYILKGNPPKPRFKVNISWTDDTNEPNKYENRLVMY